MEVWKSYIYCGHDTKRGNGKVSLEMSEKRYGVPDGMLIATRHLRAVKPGTVWLGDKFVTTLLEAALRWQSEDGPQPTQAQLEKITSSLLLDFPMTLSREDIDGRYLVNTCMEWQRRMYLAPTTGKEQIMIEKLQPLVYDLIDPGYREADAQDMADVGTEVVVSYDAVQAREAALVEALQDSRQYINQVYKHLWECDMIDPSSSPAAMEVSRVSKIVNDLLAQIDAEKGNQG